MPSNIKDILNDRALAFWIMDDGGKGTNGETILHTRAFTLEEVKLLQEALLINFSLRTLIYEKTPNQ